ncbi:MAG: glutamate formimidoyltransferase [Spirochaetales bacterium]|nr:glutamate formimidoyltransferase [Spirochaetales bacterium]
MRRLVECVPNFSEGKDEAVIRQITDAICSVEGIKLLDVDMGADTNRTVVTFVGDADIIVEGVFRGVAKAAELIDMRKHKGAHPRMGATDVCPFIPVSGITAEECVPLAEELGRRAGEELGIPMYLYAKAARREDRVKLPDIRKGEYEALEEKHKDPDFKPDFGPAKFNPTAGATATGVRDFLLAYNINISTRDRKLASDIALTVRERGRAKRDKEGVIIRDENGKALKVPGRLKNCQAAGWYIDEYGYAQVTINLTNYHETGLHHAFDVVSEEAEKRGLRVTGSEVIGLLPRKALMDSGVHYLRKMGKNVGIPEAEIIHVAILSLGLNDTVPFNPKEKIIEYAIEGEEKGLRHMTVSGFVNELSSDSMAPGGGSVSALSGALSAGLTSMVANLTYGKREHKRAFKLMEEVSLEAQKLKDRLLELIDIDTNAFNTYMEVMRLPKETDEDKRTRDAAMEEGAKGMTLVPMETLRLSKDLALLSEKVLKRGNPNALSDAAVAVIQAEAAGEGAYLNVRINLPEVKDETFVKEISREVEDLLSEIQRIKRRLFASARKHLEGQAG